MAKQRIEVRKGYIKLLRLGPIKHGEQSRWGDRAPERQGLWAFPYPFFDEFYAYHRWSDLLPKELRERYPKDPTWWRRFKADDEPPYEGDHVRPSAYDHEGDYPVESFEAITWDEYGPENHYVISERFEAATEWIEKVGRKILPVRTFWYRGDVYTRLNPSGGVMSFSMTADDSPSQWSIMDAGKFAELATKSLKTFVGYGGDGKPRYIDYSADHLELFIPRGRGDIKSFLPR